MPITQVVPSNSRATVQQYINRIANPESWADYYQLAAREDTTPDQLDQALSNLLKGTAVTAGYRTKNIGEPSRAPARVRTRYDSTCKQLKAQLTSRQQHDPELQQLIRWPASMPAQWQ